MKTILLLATLLVACLIAPAGPVYEPLAAFEAGPRNPGGKLLLHTDGNFYGTSPAGGAFNCGTIYRVTPAGEVTVLASLSYPLGIGPSAPLASDGMGVLWGTARAGGDFNAGTIFKCNSATGEVTKVYDFLAGGPSSGLVSDGNGSFWGCDDSSVYKINMTTGVLTTIGVFTGEEEGGTGVNPWLGLVNDGSGFFWGGTFGSQWYGTIFKIHIATGALTTVVRFTGDMTGTGEVGTGQWATGVLANDGAGFLWGTSTNNVFKINIATGAFTPVTYFTDSEGAAPGGNSPALVKDANGFFWGTNEVLGVAGSGIVFKINATTGVLTREFTFDFANGSQPQAGLVNDGNGFLWGTTAFGGLGSFYRDTGFGTIFKINATTGAVTTVAELVQSAGPMTASHPVGGLACDASGALWGTTEDGGIGANGVGFGTIFKVQPNSGALGKVLYFTNNSAPAKGNTPDGKLLDDGNGWFWGTTSGGGADNLGTVFKLSQATGVLTTVREFTGTSGATLGNAPIAGLVSDGGGFFWGSTYAGGTGNFGTIFKVNAVTGTLTTVVNFTGTSGIAKGKFPFGALIADGTGSFWGTTEQGGANDLGTVFKVNRSTGAVTTVTTFTGTTGSAVGRLPDAGLVSDGLGFFWGTTFGGGSSGCGTIFKVRASDNAFTSVLSFTGSTGAFIGINPIAGLVMAPDGNFWGTTRGYESQFSGPIGTIFKISPAGAFSHVFSFTGMSGSVPGQNPSLGSLLLHPDGNLYGSTYAGGVTSAGHPAGNGQIFRLRFGPSPVTQPATPVAGTTATLRGTLNPNGSATTASFEWGTDPLLVTFATASAGTAGSGTSPAAVSANLTGLAGGTTYYFRVVGANAENAQPQRGPILAFTTLSPLQQWKLTHLGNASAPDLTDPDGDGIRTLAEYGLNLLPGTPDGSPVVATRFIYAEGERLRVFVQRDPAHNDVTVEVQAAGNLSGPWSALATSALGSPFSGPGYVGGDSATAGVKTVEIRDTVNIPDAPSRFVRVRVDH